jgi:hypothetical protein
MLAMRPALRLPLSTALDLLHRLAHSAGGVRVGNTLLALRRKSLPLSGCLGPPSRLDRIGLIAVGLETVARVNDTRKPGGDFNAGQFVGVDPVNVAAACHERMRGFCSNPAKQKPNQDVVYCGLGNTTNDAA